MTFAQLTPLWRKFGLVAVMALLQALVACGGGGGSSGSAPNAGATDPNSDDDASSEPEPEHDPTN